VGEVAGQDEHHLEQRADQAEDHDHGHDLQDPPERPADHGERHEREAGRGHGDHHRQHDLLARVDRGLAARLPHLEVTLGVLDHHDRVVDDDPGRDQQTEGRDHVDRDVGLIHQKGREQVGHRHAPHGQQRLAKAGDPREDQDHEHRAAEAVGQHGVQTIADDRRVVLRDHRPDVRG
jgi:hypothetical protein